MHMFYNSKYRSLFYKRNKCKSGKISNNTICTGKIFLPQIVNNANSFFVQYLVAHHFDPVNRREELFDFLMGKPPSFLPFLPLLLFLFCSGQKKKCKHIGTRLHRANSVILLQKNVFLNIY